MRFRISIFVSTILILGLGMSTACDAEPAGADLSERVKAFDDYALVWPGDTVDVDGDGTQEKLTIARAEGSRPFVHPKTGETIRPAIRSYTLGYGTCDPSQKKRACRLPLTIVLYPPCEAPPSSASSSTTLVSLRGVDAIAEREGQLSIDTADFSVFISPPGDSPSEVLKNSLAIAAELEGANEKANHVSDTTSFRQKAEANCPDTSEAWKYLDRVDSTIPPPLDDPSAPPNAPPESPELSGCCTLQLDLDPLIIDVQATAVVSVGNDIAIDVIFGENAGPLGALQFKVVYDDTILTPLAGGTGVNGNPDLNDAVTGTAWTCSLPAGSGTPDIDPVSGPGHGVALLSCFTTTSPVTITTGTVLATLRLHVAAGGQADLAIAEAALGSHEGVELGSCNPVVDTEMTCVGGTVNPQ